MMSISAKFSAQLLDNSKKETGNNPLPSQVDSGEIIKKQRKINENLTKLRAVHANSHEKGNSLDGKMGFASLYPSYERF